MTPTERDELNRKIAEDLEPKPDNLNGEAGRTLSPLGFWRLNGIMLAYAMDRDKQYFWEPADFFADPAMTLMLMGKIVEAQGGYYIAFNLILRQIHRQDVLTEIGEAVVLAYAKMRGL